MMSADRLDILSEGVQPGSMEGNVNWTLNKKDAPRHRGNGGILFNIVISSAIEQWLNPHGC